MKSAVAALLLLTVMACSNSSPTEAEVSSTIFIRFSETVSADGPSLRVRFAELAEESRCPRNVVCIWMGNAKIRLDLVSNGNTATIFLNTVGDAQFPREASAFGYTFRLVDLQPYPEEPGPPDPPRYTAQVLVTSSP